MEQKASFFLFFFVVLGDKPGGLVYFYFFIYLFGFDSIRFDSYSAQWPLSIRPAAPAQAWNNAVTQAWKRIQSDDPVHALARAMREGRGDAVMVKPQWNMPVPGEAYRTAVFLYIYIFKQNICLRVWICMYVVYIQ